MPGSIRRRRCDRDSHPESVAATRRDPRGAVFCERLLVFCRIGRPHVRRKPQTTPRKAPRQTRSRATVETILTATARVLVQDGFERATTNRIAAVAGVSVGSLYQYFPNKQALVRALYDRQLARAESVRPPELGSDVPGLPRRALRDVIGAAVRWHLATYGRDARLHAELSAHAAAILGKRALASFERMHEARVRDRLERHRDALRTRDLALAAFLLSTCLAAVAHAAATRHPELLADDALADELTTLLVGYLEGPRRRRRTAPTRRS
jgi:AcrR family transcriptional regulator